jgi:hypothetical protein
MPEIASPNSNTTRDGTSIHTRRDSCVRFVFGIIGASRNTRVQAPRYALPGRDLHRLIAPAWLAPS